MKTFTFILIATLLWLPMHFLEAKEKYDATLPIIWNVPETPKNLIDRGNLLKK